MNHVNDVCVCNGRSLIKDSSSYCCSTNCLVEPQTDGGKLFHKYQKFVLTMKFNEILKTGNSKWCRLIAYTSDKVN